MCGIIGYIGEKPVVPILLSGLERLEYRGYDSAGIATLNGDKLEVRKVKGKISNLRSLIEREPIGGHMGIGHTRWATHGEPNDTNAHPHMNTAGDIAIVHNGIIENYKELKDSLTKAGKTFISQTDTEVIVQLLDYYYDGDMMQAVLKTLGSLQGSYSLGIVTKHSPDKLYCARKDSPLVVGKASHGSFIASDIPAILEYSRDVFLLDNMEVAVLTKDDIKIYNELGQEVKKDVLHVDWDVKTAQKGGFKHYMMKEMHEEPIALKDTLSPSIIEENGFMRLRDDQMPLESDYIKNIKRIFFVACGTAYHCGLVGKNIIEKQLRIPVIADIASEFRYRDPIIGSEDLVIVISQSGETADTIAAMKLAQSRGAKVLAICNVVGSTIAREADFVCYTWAGPEISVCSTKAYVSQLMMTYILILDIARKRGIFDDARISAALKELSALPEKNRILFEHKEKIQQFASRNYGRESVFFIGRGLDYAIAQEASLKLKEISYIHSEALAAGELKHGTIALLEEGTLVIAIALQKELAEKIKSNITECRVRGAKILTLVRRGDHFFDDVSDDIWEIPDTMPEYTPTLAILPMQLLAYYTSVQRGNDVDMPRNLAKSVTVE